MKIGQLEGWGRGLHKGPNTYWPWSGGSGHERIVSVVLQGQGSVEFTLASSRAGQVAQRVPVGPVSG